MRGHASAAAGWSCQRDIGCAMPRNPDPLAKVGLKRRLRGLGAIIILCRQCGTMRERLSRSNRHREQDCALRPG